MKRQEWEDARLAFLESHDSRLAEWARQRRRRAIRYYVVFTIVVGAWASALLYMFWPLVKRLVA